MTENDIQLIEQAERLPWSLWYVAEELAEQADSEEALKRLRRIASTLYHREEYYAGCI